MQTSKAENLKRVGSKVPSEAPSISVIIPAYSVADFIVETLDSAFSQTYTDFEVIIVNDGSPDTPRFEEMIGPFLERVVYIKQENGGVAAARNTAIENARGETIAFLDGDDVWHPDFLESQSRLLESGGFGMVYCDADLFGMPSVVGKTYMQTAPSNGEVTVESLLDLRCNVITSGTLARKHVIEAAGMFELGRVQSEDFHLWVRIAHSGAKIGYQRKVLTKYRVSPFGLSSHSINRVERSIDVFCRLDRNLQLTKVQRDILKRRVLGFESDLAVERGKALLLSGDFELASITFRKAIEHRRTVRRTAVSILSRIAPKLLLRLYTTVHSDEIPFVPTLSGSAKSN